VSRFLYYKGMMKTFIIVAIVAIFLLTVGYLLWSNNASSSKTSTSPAESGSTTKEDESGFSTPKKAAHWESNTPEHGTILAGVPINVAVDFNFDLAKGSTIQISGNGTDYSEGQSTIDPNKLVLRRAVKATAPDGIYDVSYKACWADDSCHDGEFQFKIDSSKLSTFIDMRSKKEVVIELTDLAFNPKQIRVSKGTKITWRNDDSVEHTINTDSHPAHTYFLEQNSRSLKSGDTYSVAFNQVGVYPYHCTPHAGTMTGTILVD